MVASNTKDGIGTKGISDPKKLTKLKPIYPTPGSKGKRSVKSTNFYLV
jgi:hypothetical protein